VITWSAGLDVFHVVFHVNSVVMFTFRTLHDMFHDIQNMFVYWSGLGREQGAKNEAYLTC
jgi:hypothetical protein